MSFWTHHHKFMSPNETTPGVKVLKQLWDINTDTKKNQDVQNVNSNIYAMPTKVRQVPRRNRPV